MHGLIVNLFSGIGNALELPVVIFVVLKVIGGFLSAR